jgi:hypothetical protein
MLQAKNDRVDHISFHNGPGGTSLCWTDGQFSYTHICAGRDDSKTDIIDSMQIGPLGHDSPVRLGDVIALLGPPSTSNLCISAWTTEQNNYVAEVQSRFSGGKVIITSYTPDNLLAWKVDPAQKVAYIEFYNTPSNRFSPRLPWTWRGFVVGPKEPCVFRG